MQEQQHVGEPTEEMKKEMIAHSEKIRSWYEIAEETWSSRREVAPGSGIWVYENVIPKDLGVIDRLEDVLNSPENSYDYADALVGYGVKMPDYRDCFDFKYKKTDIEHDTSEAGKKLVSLWEDTHYRQLQAVKDYTSRYNIGELRYWEATNYVKYGPGQHFQEHHDHGYSYNCVVSLVAFPNDDYEGGELGFPEYGPQRYRAPAGSAIVFSCSLLHDVSAVTRGRRYVFLPFLYDDAAAAIREANNAYLDEAVGQYQRG
jgi:hypothetical protein